MKLRILWISQLSFLIRSIRNSDSYGIFGLGERIRLMQKSLLISPTLLRETIHIISSLTNKFSHRSLTHNRQDVYRPYTMRSITIGLTLLVGGISAQGTCPYSGLPCSVAGAMACCSNAGSTDPGFVTCTAALIFVYSPCGQGTKCVDNGGALSCA